MKKQKKRKFSRYDKTLLRRKGIFILPNLFTTSSLFTAFFAIIAAMNSHFQSAAVAIFISMVLDGLDGRVARLINAQSPFGAEYDSLVDIIAFGVAPAILMYKWCFPILQNFNWGKFAWLTAFLYLACVALRLARFNSNLAKPKGKAKRYFYGLPCPAAAAVVTSTIWMCYIYGLQNTFSALVVPILTVLIGLLQISNIPFRSFKDIDLKNNVKLPYILLIVLILIFLTLMPAHTVFIVFLLYAISGPNACIRKQRQLKKINKTRTRAKVAKDLKEGL